MNPELWAAVDAYFDRQLGLSDPELEATLAASRAAGLPEIQVAPNQGRLLQLLARLAGARRILEIGTLGGYSTIWLARALPADDPAALVLTLECEARHAAVARDNLARAGLAGRVELRVGTALDTLETLRRDRAAAFDFVFIDADKENNAAYFDHAVELCRPGALIVIDNVVRRGAVADPAATEAPIVGTRALFDRMGRDPRVLATALQTVGSKGHDGLALAWVVAA